MELHFFNVFCNGELEFAIIFFVSLAWNHKKTSRSRRRQCQIKLLKFTSQFLLTFFKIFLFFNTLIDVSHWNQSVCTDTATPDFLEKKYVTFFNHELSVTYFIIKQVFRKQQFFLRTTKNHLWEDMTILREEGFEGRGTSGDKINTTFLKGNEVLNIFHSTTFSKKNNIFQNNREKKIFRGTWPFLRVLYVGWH